MTPKFDETLSGQEVTTYSRANRRKQKRGHSPVREERYLETAEEIFLPLTPDAQEQLPEDQVVEEVVEEVPARPTTRVKFSHHVLILFFSLLVSGLSIAVPNFTELANSVQSQQLYTGLMLSQGQLPYRDIFATGGFFYYGIIALSYHFGSTLWLVLAQVIANYLSGLYLNKLVAHLTGYREAGGAITAVFYLLLLTLGFGGLYPIQFALPFVLVGLWVLANYFGGTIRDELFIVYGLAAAAAILFEPRTLVFWALSTLFLFGYNMIKGYFAKGFYQVLCVLVGAASLLFVAGYFIFNLELLLPYLKQTLVFNATVFATGNESLVFGAGFQLAVALVSGLFVGWLVFFYHIWKTKRDRVMKWLLFLTLSAYVTMIALSQAYDLSHQLMLLPYGLLLSALILKPKSDDLLTHRKSPAYSAMKFFKQFMLKHAFLPCAIMLYAVTMPILSYLNDGTTTQERLGLATYLADKTKATDRIYVWDDNALIYLASARKTASQLATPVVYTTSPNPQALLTDELLQQKAKYIVVNVDQPVTADIQGLLKDKYQLVDLTNLTQFKVYRAK